MFWANWNGRRTGRTALDGLCRPALLPPGLLRPDLWLSGRRRARRSRPCRGIWTWPAIWTCSPTASAFSGLVGGALRRVWSDVAHLRGRHTLRDLATLFAQGGLRDALPLIGNPDAFGRRVFRVVVKPFMDAHTYDQKRIEQCCTKILDERGEAVSFCEYNVFHRGRKRREAVVPLAMVK